MQPEPGPACFRPREFGASAGVHCAIDGIGQGAGDIGMIDPTLQRLANGLRIVVGEEPLPAASAQAHRLLESGATPSALLLRP